MRVPCVLVAAAALALVGCVHAAAITFTGNVPVDFPNGPGVFT
jgi:hypothetical protein